MSPTPAATVAAAIVDHHPIEDSFYYQCNGGSCGHGEDTASRWATHVAAAVLEALAAAGWELVQLPGQCIIPTGWGDDCLGAWPVEDGYRDPVSAWPKGEVAEPDGDFMPAERAKALGLALLAAAAAASLPTTKEQQP